MEEGVAEETHGVCEQMNVWDSNGEFRKLA